MGRSMGRSMGSMGWGTGRRQGVDRTAAAEAGTARSKLTAEVQAEERRESWARHRASPDRAWAEPRAEPGRSMGRSTGRGTRPRQ
eukprot:10222032-Alexandrium_andersonii.AAC.1